MTHFDRENSAESGQHGFERWLLDSAREDELPRDVAGAWERFGAGLASVGGGALHTGSRRAHTGSAAAALHGARLVAVKWVVVGALAGSALTFFGMSRIHESRAHDSRAHEAAAPVSTPVSASAPLTVGFATVAPAAAALSEPERAPASAASRNVSRERHEAASRPSTLGAQVALLDAARAAMVTGDAEAALRATNRFQREFPGAELYPDAEVVAIEALSASGDRAALARRAALFLEHYPADPHARRVKALAER